MQVGIGKSFTGAFIASTVLVVALVVMHDGSRYEAKGTFRTQDLIVDNTADVGATLNAGPITQTHLATNRDVSIGVSALSSNIDGLDDTAIGFQALQNLIGTDPMHGPNNGVNDIAIGTSALQNATIAEQNIAIGDQALFSLVNARNNIAIGLNSLTANLADANISIGTNSLPANTTGTNNIAIGVIAGLLNQDGSDNIILGGGSLTANVSGNDSIAIGFDALQSSNTIQNIGVGTFALRVATGYQNTGVGTASCGNVSSGIANACFGDQTGGGIATGSNNTVLGANVHGLDAATEAKVILADGTGTATDQIWLSPPAPTSVSHGSLGTGSSNTVGNVTGIGSNTSVVLTFSNSGFPNRSWCQAQPNTHTGAVEQIVVTNSATAPTFSCFDVTTGSAANCEDFTYWCTGQ